ncbi:MAG: AmmeMemoRadiSam system protein A [Nitrospinae bacterium]|nr:AmmeMemoRadiSam system protein A [Nitrospinota bacterium]
MDPIEQKILLRLSRRVLREYAIKGKATKDLIKDFEITGTMKKNAGVFVTLQKHGELRGCIGYITPREPLYQAVIDSTINAAFQDPRFSPVDGSELDDIDISISVLSVPEEVPGPSHFQPGLHGVILKKGIYSAVFLPQVATEQGWDRDETLRHLSRKAGLSENAWKDKDARFEVFTAEVFGEKK